MSKKIQLVVFLILTSNFLLAINIQQNVPNLIENDSQTKFSLTIDEYSNISEINMFYKFSQGEIFQKKNIELDGNMGKYEVILTIPKGVTEIEYYYKISLQNGIIYSYPEFNPELQPFRLQILNNHSNLENIFTLLNPSNFNFNSKDEIMIAISYFPISDKVDTQKSTLIFDGKKIKDANVTKNIAVANLKNISGGSHYFQMKITLKNGKIILSQKWDILIGNNIRKSIKYNGNIAYFSYYNKTKYDNNNDVKNTQNDVTLNFNALYNKNNLRGNIYLTSLESGEKQSVNRFSFIYNIPFLELDLGDNTPYYSKLGINKNVRGINSNLHFHYFRILSTYGFLKRNIPCKKLDSSHYSQGSFDRKISAARIEIGPENKFEFGLSFIKNKDIVSSLEKNEFITNDSLNSLIITPKDNVVLGSDFKLSLLKRRLQIYGEISVSMLNNNIYDGAISNEDLEDYGIDLPFSPQDYEQLFIINKNVIPYKLSTAMAAISSGIKYYDRLNNVNFNFSQYGSAYNSLSASVPQDKRIFSFSDQLNIQNKFFLLLGGSISRNNLSDDKVTTNIGDNLFSNILIRTSSSQTFHFTGQYSLNKNEDNSLESTYKLIESGYDFSILQQSDYPTNMTISLSRSSNNSNNYPNNSEKIITAFNFYSLSKLSQFPIDIKLGITLNNLKDVQNFEDLTRNDINSKYWNNNYVLGTKFHFMDDKIIPYFNYIFTHVIADDSQQKNNIILGTSYFPFPKTRITTKLSISHYSRDDNSDIVNYRKNIWSLNIVQQF